MDLDVVRDGGGAILMVIVIFAIGAAILSIMLAGSAVLEQPQSNTSITLDSGETTVPNGVEVSATKENALAFPGDGYVDGPGPANGSKTVCAAGQLDGDANGQATYTLYGAENGSVLLQYDAGQWMGYVEANGDSAKATMNAANPDEWRRVCLRYNATASTVTVSRDTTVGSPVAMDGDTERRNASFDWFGKIDEVRTFGNPVPNATLSAYGDDAIQPFPDENRTGRMMFDEGEGGSTEVYWANTDATLVNASWTSGLSDVPLDRGTDYQLSGDPFQITLTDSGYLDGAPIVWISWLSLPLGINFAAIMSSVATILLIGVAVMVVSKAMDSGF